MNYRSILSDKAKSLKPSGIRRFFDLASETEGVISLGVGEPDFKTPKKIVDAAIESLKSGETKYTANAGLITLREEISNYMHRRLSLTYDPKDEILVTVGASEGIDIVVRSLVNPGDEVIVVEPCFVSYLPIITLAGGVPVTIETKEQDEFRLTANQLKEKISDKTKLIMLSFPCNPTGGIMKKNHLDEIYEVIKDTDILVLSDEIYADLTYDGTHVSIAQIENMRERTIIANGFSKAYAMTGWRLGFVCGPREIIEQVNKIHQYAIMCSPTTSQFAAVVALRDCDKEVEEMREEYKRRRDLITNGFNQMGLNCFKPGGAFYVFPSIKSTGLTSEDFCQKLLASKKIAVVPGSVFGESGEGFIRVSYAYSIEYIKKALEKIKEFIEELK